MGELSRTYFDISYSHISAVDILLKQKPYDDTILNICCYHMQQAFELLLKYVLNGMNVNYTKTHNIGYLIKLAETKIPLYCDKLKMVSNMLTEWESKSRYVLDFYLNITLTQPNEV